MEQQNNMHIRWSFTLGLLRSLLLLGGPLAAQSRVFTKFDFSGATATNPDGINNSGLIECNHQDSSGTYH